jgi:hypothetical protein
VYSSSGEAVITITAVAAAAITVAAVLGSNAKSLLQLSLALGSVQ